MGGKMCPKIILEGARLTLKTDVAFALNEHPRVVGPGNTASTCNRRLQVTRMARRQSQGIEHADMPPPGAPARFPHVQEADLSSGAWLHGCGSATCPGSASSHSVSRVPQRFRSQLMADSF